LPTDLVSSGRVFSIDLKEKTMPHVVVKLVPGKSYERKTCLAEEITKQVIKVLNRGEAVVSVAFREVERQDWAEKVL
jgi:4-oxalocrotonate tautomerase